MAALATNAAAAEPMLDIERFDCYEVALQFQEIAAGLLAKGAGALRDQLDRASTSVALNLAEGIGRRARREKAHFYAVARGSALESAAILDLASRRGLADGQACADGRKLLVRLVQMLTKLEQRMRR
jgi:four helix bundle protein